jgi:hypothetical protein
VTSVYLAVGISAVSKTGAQALAELSAHLEPASKALWHIRAC